jgi:hypothetical protein
MEFPHKWWQTTQNIYVDVTGKGWYKPFFLLLGLLVQQSMHPLINRATYSCSLVYYTYLSKLETIFLTTKCIATLEV